MNLLAGRAINRQCLPLTGAELDRGSHRAIGFGVYTGGVELKDGPLRVLPVKKFLAELARGNVLQ